MDINRSPLSGYQSNKSEASTQVSQAFSSDSARVKETTHNPGVNSLKLSDLKEGQTIKGQIIDHRYQEVKLQLEPGKQLITAKLASPIPLSIGEEASFIVSEDPSKQLVLKYIPNASSDPTTVTVTKALQASKLPLTERNKAIATELINHRMPLDKQTLQNLVRLAYKNSDASPLTLVLMNKYELLPSPSNIAQFEAYLKGNQQFFQDIKHIAHNLSALLGSSEPSNHSPALLESSPASSVTNPLPTEQLVQINDRLLNLLRKGEASVEETPQLSSLLNQQELTLITQLVEERLTGSSGLIPKTTDDTQKEMLVANQQQPLGETPEAAAQLKTLLADLHKGSLSSESSKLLLELLNTKASGTVWNATLTNQVPLTLEQLIGKLTEYQRSLEPSPKLSAILGAADLDLLYSHLIELPNSGPLLEGLSQDTLRLKETLSFLQSQLPKTDPETAVRLISSPEYAKVFEEALIHKWSLTPEKLTKQNTIEALYQEVQEDLQELKQLTNSVRDAEAMLQVKEPAQKLQDNLQFIKHLNEAFTYLPLPIQFKDQNVPTDLYVLSRNRAHKNQEDPVSVLLHLELRHLGALNIHIQLVKQKITADFYPEDKGVAGLLKEHLSNLTDALYSKGYQIQAEVKDEYKKPDFHKDFIEHNSPDYNVMQYSFDIRT